LLNRSDEHILIPSKALDQDGDSQMQSSHTEEMTSVNPATPDTRSHELNALNALASELSPPSSQGVPLLSPINGANANGKRPLSTLDVNGDAPPSVRSDWAPATEPAVVHTHEVSGYKWTRQEDEPGWAWKNKKALDEYHRAYDTMIMKDFKIGGEFIWRGPKDE